MCYNDTNQFCQLIGKNPEARTQTEMRRCERAWSRGSCYGRYDVIMSVTPCSRLPVARLSAGIIRLHQPQSTCIKGNFYATCLYTYKNSQEHRPDLRETKFKGRKHMAKTTPEPTPHVLRLIAVIFRSLHPSVSFLGLNILRWCRATVWETHKSIYGFGTVCIQHYIEPGKINAFKSYFLTLTRGFLKHKMVKHTVIVALFRVTATCSLIEVCQRLKRSLMLLSSGRSP